MWRNSFSDLLNQTRQERQRRKLYRILKNNKSAEAAAITVNMLNASDVVAGTNIQKECRTKSKLPNICFIFKKGDKLRCKDYKEIALMKMDHRILIQCLKNLLNKD